MMPVSVNARVIKVRGFSRFCFPLLRLLRAAFRFRRRTPVRMRLAPIGLIAVLALAAHAQSFEFPKRKSGLWEMETTSSTRTAEAQKAQMCIDQKSDDAMNQMGTQMTKEMCSKRDVHREGEAIVANSVCKFGESTVTTHAVITGKFDSAYQVETRSTYDPPMAGVKEASALVRAHWLGPCKADQKPGDMILPNGRKLNINDRPSQQ